MTHKKLQELNWNNYSDDRIISILTSIPISWPILELPMNVTIDRAVRIAEGEEIANFSRLSYCPVCAMSEKQKTRYQRCNLPGQEMFYGSLLPDNADGIKFSRIISICESSRLFRTQENGEEVYGFGTWEQTRPLKCAVIVDDKNEYGAAILKDAQNHYKKKGIVLNDNHRFIASIFSSSVSDDMQYRLSAIYADFLFANTDIDAIVYPSVQTGAEGACISINPQCINDNSIKLIAAIKSKVVMKDKELSISNIERGCVSEQGKLTFIKI